MLSNEFLSGHYQKSISSSFDQGRMCSTNEITSLIGSLCFSGKLLEGQKIYKSHYQDLSEIEKSACRFFLGIAFTRKSQYKDAFKKFNKNLKSLNKNSISLQRFYTYQGIAFYLFFLGKLELSMKWALKSFDAALDSKDLYARSLSTDLLAHIKLRLGEINVGLDLLKSAEKIARKLGNKSISEAIEIANLQYQAQYGYERSTILNLLENKFNQLVSEDNYSRTGVGLELARQYTLRGRYDLSENILMSISTMIFATENRRQEIQLNLRFAENYYQVGKPTLAWNYLRSARRCLNFEADKSFEIQIMGFEYKLFDETAKIDLKIELLEKAKFFNSVINHNILLRNNIGVQSLYSQEDLYYNFITSLESESEKIERIIESGYYSLLWEAVGVKRGENLFYFDQDKNKVILFCENKIEIPSERMTPTDHKLLLAILNSKKSKEEICQMVWGYKYDPLRHDSIIYTGIRSLRKKLGSAGGWVETSESGYHFSRDKKFILNNSAKVLPETLHTQQESLKTFSSDLNLRQIKALQYLKKNESLDVMNYQKLFKVSDVTACDSLLYFG